MPSPDPVQQKGSPDLASLYPHPRPWECAERVTKAREAE